MIEVYLFYVFFSIQVLLLSIVHPFRLGRFILAAREKYPYAEYPGMYPCPPDSLAKMIQLYLGVNILIAFSGIYLLSRFYSIMQTPGWSDGEIETLVTLYFFVQVIPLFIFSVFMHRFNRELRRTASTGRVSASLKRRSLYDYISPAILNLTLVFYPVYLLFLVYANNRGFPGFAGIPVNAVVVTLLYVWTLGYSYLKVSGKRANPYQGEAERHFDMEMTVKICVYSCLFGVIFLMVNMTLAMTDRQNFEPLAMCVFFVLCATLYIRGMGPASFQFEMDGYKTN
jgi:hypothetical protein